MKLRRRTFLHLTATTVALPAVSRIARAQAYPTRPVHVIVGYPAGNASDIVARLIAQSLSERFGQQFIVENKPGAGSNIGTEFVVRSPPDGYTLLMEVVTAKRNQCDVLYEPQFQFHPGHHAGREHRQRRLCHRDQSIDSSQDAPGIHRLCQGQSGQNQYGLDR
jgi:hypothetical protein